MEVQRTGINSCRCKWHKAQARHTAELHSTTDRYRTGHCVQCSCSGSNYGQGIVCSAAAAAVTTDRALCAVQLQR